MTHIDGDRIFLDLSLYEQLGKPARLVCAFTEQDCYLAAGDGIPVKDYQTEPNIRHPDFRTLLKQGEVFAVVRERYGVSSCLLAGCAHHFHSKYTRLP